MRITPLYLARLYSRRVVQVLGRAGYDVLGGQGERSRVWHIFETLASELRDRGVDPEQFMAAQFELVTKVERPYPRMLLSPGVWRRYEEYKTLGLDRHPQDLKRIGGESLEVSLKVVLEGALYMLKTLLGRFQTYSRFDLYLAFPHLLAPIFIVGDPVYGKEAGKRLSCHPGVRVGIRKAGKLLADPRYSAVVERFWSQHASEFQYRRLRHPPVRSRAVRPC